MLGLFSDFGETSWGFSGNGALCGFGGLGVLGGVGEKHEGILPVNALIHDTILWKSSEWINGSSSSDFWRRIPSSMPKAEATYTFSVRRPSAENQLADAGTLRQDHQPLLDGIRQKIP